MHNAPAYIIKVNNNSHLRVAFLPNYFVVLMISIQNVCWNASLWEKWMSVVPSSSGY